MDCATPLKVVRATIQPTPNSSTSSTAAHCGGAQDRAAMTMAATAAAASTRPSVERIEGAQAQVANVALEHPYLAHAGTIAARVRTPGHQPVVLAGIGVHAFQMEVAIEHRRWLDQPRTAAAMRAPSAASRYCACIAVAAACSTASWDGHAAASNAPSIHETAMTPPRIDDV
ncbi:hypothetical protein G6F63_013749 [Rhizopus arrhizus]|nr:hypothetical protein G6F63_013749 [Rhizopus arrhizus]